jgi:hypothetical protein
MNLFETLGEMFRPENVKEHKKEVFYNKLFGSVDTKELSSEKLLNEIELTFPVSYIGSTAVNQEYFAQESIKTLKKLS